MPIVVEARILALAALFALQACSVTTCPTGTTQEDGRCKYAVETGTRSEPSGVVASPEQAGAPGAAGSSPQTAPSSTRALAGQTGSVSNQGASGVAGQTAFASSAGSSSFGVAGMTAPALPGTSPSAQAGSPAAISGAAGVAPSAPALAGGAAAPDPGTMTPPPSSAPDPGTMMPPPSSTPDPGTMMPMGACTLGMSETCDAGQGACKPGMRSCNGTDWGPCMSMAAPMPEDCNNVDDDCDGKVDEGLMMQCGKSNTPPCHFGMQLCVAGAWSACSGNADPAAEVCDAQMVDENCNGMHNEGCECSGAQTRDCPAKPGICAPGRQSCVNGRWSTACDGAVPGTPEVCDGKDNDCANGVDDGTLCPAGQSCKGSKGCQSDAPTGAISAAIKTSGGYYITFTNGGGLGGPNSGSGATAIHTDGRSAGQWETFTIEWQDSQYKQFALKTSGGYYVTAVNGGGIGGPNDATSPIHTDGRSIGAWESFTINISSSGKATISQGGYYMTAVNGGGFAGANDMPIHTDGRSVGQWEIFTLVRN